LLHNCNTQLNTLMPRKFCIYTTNWSNRWLLDFPITLCWKDECLSNHSIVT